jgi:hypothetical protein
MTQRDRSGTHSSQEDELRAILLLLVLGDEVIGVCVSKVEAGAGAPVTKKPTFDVVLLERLAEEGVASEEDL